VTAPRGGAGGTATRLLAQLRLIFDPPPTALPAPEPMHVRPSRPVRNVEDDPASTILAPPSASPVPPRLVRHPRARQYVLRVLPDGTPRVTIPRWGSKREALAFLEAQRDWVARQRARQAARSHAAPSRVWRDGHQVLLGGRLVPLARGSGRAGVIEHDGRLVVTPRPCDGDDLRPIAVAWMVARARHVLPRQLLTLAARFDLDVSHVSVRNQRARWGSCATGGRISLNWRLVQTPDEVRDYVLIHELMHLRQPNHSARFWALVARACPGYETSRRWLRAHEGALLDAR
jgi:predicted metal-dependent hydrolase